MYLSVRSCQLNLRVFIDFALLSEISWDLQTPDQVKINQIDLSYLDFEQWLIDYPDD